MPVDPTRAFREAIRTLHISYATPFLATVGFAFALGLVGLSLFFPPWMMPYVAVSGLVSGALAFLLIGYSALLKPDLLRSEQHTERNRIIEIVGDKEQPIELRQELQRSLVPGSKRTKGLIEPKRSESDDG